MSEEAVIKTLQTRYDQGVRWIKSWDYDIESLTTELAEKKATRKRERKIVAELHAELLAKGVDLPDE
jgi:hypothetical protein